MSGNGVSAAGIIKLMARNGGGEQPTGGNGDGEKKRHVWRMILA